MPTPNLCRRLLIAGLFITLAGFTPPTGGIGGTGRPRGGIGGTGITAIGVIQKFGSIYVNGTEYLLQPTTRYRIDGIEANDRELRRGDVVIVDAARQDQRSIARTVRVQHALIGMIEAVGRHKTSLTILGQHVVIRTFTRGATIGHLGAAPLRAGMTVAVSAFESAPGVWQASRVQPLTGLSTGTHPFLIRGTIAAFTGRTVTLDQERFRVTLGARPSPPAGSEVVARGYYQRGRPVITHIRTAASLQNATGSKALVAGYIRHSAGGWHYQGMSLGGATQSAPNPSGQPVFFIATRNAAGTFVIRRLAFNIHVMTYGLAADRPPIGRTPRHTRPQRPRPPHAVIEHPHIMRPEIRASIGHPMVLVPEIQRPSMPDGAPMR